MDLLINVWDVGTRIPADAKTGVNIALMVEDGLIYTKGLSASLFLVLIGQETRHQSRESVCVL